MQKFTTSTQLKRWTPDGRDQANCGDGLYVRAAARGRKVFRYRHGKDGWSDLGDFETHLSWADAKSMCFEIKKARKRGLNKHAIDAAISRCDYNPDSLRRLLGDNSTVLSFSNAPSFRDYYLDWYHAQVAKNRWTGKASIRRPLSALEVHLDEPFGSIELNKLSRRYITQELEKMFGRAPSRVKDIYAFVHEIFERACNDQYIDANPVPSIKSLTIPKYDPRPHGELDWREAPKLWQWIEKRNFSEPMKLAMKMQMVSVHRSAVIANMRWEHWDLEIGEHTVPARMVGDNNDGFMKNGQEFSVRFPKGLVKRLVDIFDGGKSEGYVFEGSQGAAHIAPDSLRINFKRYDSSITAHGWRSTFHGWADNNAVDERIIDKYCDHKPSGTKKHYRRDSLWELRYETAEAYFSYLNGGTDD